MDRKATVQRNVIERLCVCKRDGVDEWEGEIAASLLRCQPLRDLLPGERIMKAVKWGCVNMPAVEERDVG